MKSEITKENAAKLIKLGLIIYDKEIWFRGKKYNNLSQLLRHYNIYEKSTHFYQFSRKNPSKSLEEKLEDYFLYLEQNFYFDGNKWITAKQACEKYQLNYKSFEMYKHRYQISTKEAIEKTKARQTVNLIREECRKKNINYKNISRYARVHNISIYDAYKQYPYSNGKAKTIEYNGILYESIRQLCHYFGLNPTTITEYAKRHDKSIEETIDYYLKNPPIPCDRTPYTLEEDEILQNYYQSIGAKNIHSLYLPNRSIPAIRNRACILGVATPRHKNK